MLRITWKKIHTITIIPKLCPKIVAVQREWTFVMIFIELYSMLVWTIVIHHHLSDNIYVVS